MFQCSFGNMLCNTRDAFRNLGNDQGLCLSFNPGKHGTLFGKLKPGEAS